jgi:glucose/arabinose dehydrogenase
MQNSSIMIFSKAFGLIIASVLLYAGCGSSGSDKTTGNDTQITTEQEASNLDLKYSVDKIKVPEGFKVTVYAEVPDARSMCRGAKGTLFVGNRSGDNVYAAVDNDKDGRADKVYTIASGLNTPNGVAFKDGSLYIAEISRVLRIDNIEDNLANPPKPVVVYDKYPTKTLHGWKFIAFGPDGKLYVPVGAPCNVCEEKDPVFASITRINPDGTGMEVFSHGIRNTVGFAWHPDTKQLWFTDNGRDMMGENMPGDELNIAPNANMHFGFPFCQQGNTSDPQFGKGKDCNSYVAPAKILDPHVAALGMRFYTGTQFPEQYRKQIFIAEHGSWNRSSKIGYRVMLVTLQGNVVTAYAPFAEGWLQRNDNVLGRPVDVEVDADGALLVSDDYAGVIYRIAYSK